MEKKDCSEDEKVERLTARVLVCKAQIAELTARNEKISKEYDQYKMLYFWEKGLVKGLQEAIRIILEAQSGREKE